MRSSDRAFKWMHRTYEKNLRRALAHSAIHACYNSNHGCHHYLSFYLHTEGFFSGTGHGAHHRYYPGGTGYLLSGHAGENDPAGYHQEDPAVEYVAAFTGGGEAARNEYGPMFMSLKPFNQRKASVRQVMYGSGGSLPRYRVLQPTFSPYRTSV